MNSKNKYNLQEIYERSSIVEYYNKIVIQIGLLKSEQQVFADFVDINNEILDIGCGAGRTTIGLKNIGYNNIVGIDISEGMIKNAKKNNDSIKFIQADVMHLPFENDTFNTAFFSFNGLMLLPGIENRVKALVEIKRILSSQGLLIFSTPYLDNKMEKLFWKERTKEYSPDSIEFGDVLLEDMDVDGIYIHIPFIKEIQSMLDQVGFEVLECKPRTSIAYEIDRIENELDDNLFWIVRCK